eukprot:764185-Hanusia_phi.AAC.1
MHRSVACYVLLLCIKIADCFIYPLHPHATDENLWRTGDYNPITEVVRQKFLDVERRWSSSLPTLDDTISSPPVDNPFQRGPYAERRDYALNLQPGAPFFQPLDSRPGTISADGLRGGNFCDEGALDSECIIYRPLSFPGNYTISGMGVTPFVRTATTYCDSLDCACNLEFVEFLPSKSDLLWASITVEIEEGSAFVTSKLKSTLIDGHLLQGECQSQVSCKGQLRSNFSDQSSCFPGCGTFYKCLSQIDITDYARDGIIHLNFNSNEHDFVGTRCGGHVLNVRVTIVGEYKSMGSLRIARGGGVFCVLQNCSITFHSFRMLSLDEGSRIFSDRVTFTVNSLRIAGHVAASNLQVCAGAMNLSHTGKVSFVDSNIFSTCQIYIQPNIVESKYSEELPLGCNAHCLPCSCFVVDGHIHFSVILITGISLFIGAEGHISADGLGQFGGQGAGAGRSSQSGGGGGGFGGHGSGGCAIGSGEGGLGYGEAVAPNMLGMCLTLDDCQGDFSMQMGSGGGHGTVEAARGGGAVRVLTSVEVRIMGLLSADGEDSACYLNEVTKGSFVSEPGGGAGSGGSVWISSTRLLGSGVVSANGGSANRSCDTIQVVTSGGGGGGGRIAIDYSAFDLDLSMKAYGGTSLCASGGAGTVFDSIRKVYFFDNGEEYKMSSDFPSSFAYMQDQPTILVALTPWPSWGVTESLSRQVVCCLNSTRVHYPVNGCNPAVVEQVYVQKSALAEFPKSNLTVLVVQQSGSVIATSSSAMLTIDSKIVLRNGLIGCLGCSTSSFDVSRNSCDEICPAWKIVCEGDIVMDGYSKMMGNNITIASQNVYISEGAALYPSSWYSLSSFDMDCFSLTLNGTIHFSSTRLNATNIGIFAAGSISADAIGGKAGTGLGDGPSTRYGGGGGGHGGQGAQACFSNMTGGVSYDQLIPTRLGSAGGYGGLNLTAAELEEATKRSSDGSLNLSSLSSAGWLVRQVRRTKEFISLASSFCLLRGIRSFPGLVPQYVTPLEMLPRFKTACPVGMRGSSMRDWCCSGMNCDCVLVRNDSVPGGRGGGTIQLVAYKQLQLNGSISANGEGCACNRHPTFSTGGGGAGGSISISAEQFLGAGSISSAGGSVLVACPSTISGGGGAGGRIFLKNHDIAVVDPISLSLNVSAFGGRSGGCGAGGAGTILLDVNQTLIVDNGFASFWSAMTPFLPQDPSHARLSDIIVRRRASLEFPRADALGPSLSVWVRDKGFLVAQETSSQLRVKALIVLNDGLVGCLHCWSSTDVMNDIPGCSDKPTVCPVMTISTQNLVLQTTSKIYFLTLNISVSDTFFVDETSEISAADHLTLSRLNINSTHLRCSGLIRSSSLDLTGLSASFSKTCKIVSKALGHPAGSGPSPGPSGAGGREQRQRSATVLL